MTKEKVAVAMSGGVDSSVTAALLQKQGYRVEGVFMALAQPDIAFQTARVQAMADRLGIGLKVVDLHREFAAQVLAYFRDSYLRGLTPNPCVICNRQIKFGLLLDAALAGGAAFMATGHYVRLRHDPGDALFHLERGCDPGKDQSYFLCLLRQAQLARLKFPLGEYLKDEVYEMAAELGLEFSGTEESQDVCFLKDQAVGAYLEAGGDHGGAGPVVTGAGREIGCHEGLHWFTIGQRRGLGLPDATPWYVTGLEPEGNRVVVGKKEDLFRARLQVEELSWLSGRPPQNQEGLAVRIRYRHQPAPARVVCDRQGGAEIIFAEPQRAITPGQFAAIYRGGELLGGGAISRFR